MKTVVVTLTVEVEDNFIDDLQDSNLSSIIVDAIDHNEFCSEFIKNYSISLNS